MNNEFTINEMLETSKEARKIALEEAAKIADEYILAEFSNGDLFYGSQIGEAIRKLMEG